VYPFIYVEAFLFEYGVHAIQRDVNCSDATISGKIVQAMKTNVDIDIYCQGNRWQYLVESTFYAASKIQLLDYSSRILCVNCVRPMSCISSSKKAFVVGSDELCFTGVAPNEYAVRVGMNLQIQVQVYVPPTVPVISHVNTTAGSTSLTAVLELRCV